MPKLTGENIFSMLSPPKIAYFLKSAYKLRDDILLTYCITLTSLSGMQLTINKKRGDEAAKIGSVPNYSLEVKDRTNDGLKFKITRKVSKRSSPYSLTKETK